MTTVEDAAGVGATAAGAEAPTLFLRKATGLVRGWSVRDAVIYAALSTNVVTLGIVEFAFNSFIPKGQLLSSILISGVWVSFLVVTYAGLVVTIPRAGGDYVWQSRILGGPVGFVMSATGWWFILWLWAPIYGAILSEDTLAYYVQEYDAALVLVLVQMCVGMLTFMSVNRTPARPGALVMVHQMVAVLIVLSIFFSWQVSIPLLG